MVGGEDDDFIGIVEDVLWWLVFVDKESRKYFRYGVWCCIC